MSHLKLHLPDGTVELFPCPTRSHFENMDFDVTEAWSYKHAASKGWNATSDPRFCDPTKSFVFVCPSCWDNCKNLTAAKQEDIINETKR